MTPAPQIPPRVAVGSAIQSLAAKRLGRGFVPLGLLCLVGLGETLTGRGSGWLLALGALLSALATLAYGMRVVQKAFGRGDRPWMRLAAAASLLPPAFGLYVFAWRGLRAVAAGGGPGTGLAGLLLAVLGAWHLRGWMRLLELRRLAEAMTVAEEHSPEAGT